MENKSQEDSKSLKEFREVVEKAGGIQILREALENPVRQEQKPTLPPQIQRMVDEGNLDPSDPKDALIINLYGAFNHLQGNLQTRDYKEATSTFEEGLKTRIAEKYKYANLDVIRQAAYNGKWNVPNMTNDQFWQSVEDFAKPLNEANEALIQKAVDAKLGTLTDLGKGSVRTGKAGKTNPVNMTPRQAFESEYNKHFKDDE